MRFIDYRFKSALSRENGWIKIVGRRKCYHILCACLLKGIEKKLKKWLKRKDPEMSPFYTEGDKGPQSFGLRFPQLLHRRLALWDRPLLLILIKKMSYLSIKSTLNTQPH